MTLGLKKKCAANLFRQVNNAAFLDESAGFIFPNEQIQP